MTNTRAALTTFLVFILILLAGILFLKALFWVENIDSETGKPVKTFVVHVDYNAYEDQISCPGTPGAVLDYTPLPDGQADILCATPLHK